MIKSYISCFVHCTIQNKSYTQQNLKGSLFELTGGAETKLGFVGTAALAAIGAPFSLFLLYAAIMKGAAETEEDDREYNSPSRF